MQGNLQGFELQTRAQEDYANRRMKVIQDDLAASERYLAEQEHVRDAIVSMEETILEVTTHVNNERRKANEQMAAADAALARAYQQQWDAIGHGVSNSFTSMLDSMLAGTFNLQKSLASVGQQILNNMIRNIVMGEARHIAAEQAKAGASILSANIQGEAATDATKTGMEQSGLFGLKQVIDDAYRAASGAYAATVGNSIHRTCDCTNRHCATALLRSPHSSQESCQRPVAMTFRRASIPIQHSCTRRKWFCPHRSRMPCVVWLQVVAPARALCN